MYIFKDQRMAEKIQQGFNANQKKQNLPEAIRIQHRDEHEQSKQSKKFAHLFYKRTKVHYDSNDAGKSDMLSLEDVKILSKELSRKSKSNRQEESLKSLIKAFSTDASYVDAFLEGDRSLWNLVGCLTGNNGMLQIYAAYCITNITSTDHRYSKVVAKACSCYLITYLASEVPLLQDLCATALGNIASDGEEFRELLKVQGIMKPLVNLFKTTSPAVLEAAAFLAIKLCAGSEETTNEFLELGIGQLLVENLQKCKSETATGQMAWLLFYLASDEMRMIHLIELGMLDVTLNHLKNSGSSMSRDIFSLTALLRILGNAAALNKPPISQKVSEIGVVSLLKPLVEYNYSHIVKEALWTTSNIIAMDEKFASQIISENMLQSFERCLNYGEVIQKEVLICICTISSYGGIFLEAVANNKKLMDEITHFLSHKNNELVILALQFLEMVLRMQSSDMDNLQRTAIQPTIDMLRNHEDVTTRTLADNLCVLYFSDTHESMMY